MGVELLRKMGWKEGQGVGPRVKRRARHGGRWAPGREWRSKAVMFGKPERCCVCLLKEGGAFMAARCPLQDRRTLR